MNKTFKTFFYIFLGILIISLISCDSKDKFLSDYENYVQSIEKKVEQHQDIDYELCELEVAKYSDRYEELRKLSSWKNYEETKYQQLNTRLWTAIGTSAARQVKSGVMNFLKDLEDLLD